MDFFGQFFLKTQVFSTHVDILLNITQKLKRNYANSH
jgi:hypothetical protein